MGEVHDDESCPFIKELDKLKNELNVMDQNLKLSAVYGKSLIEENTTLQIEIKDLRRELENWKQENHQMKLQLERSKLAEVNHLQEAESLKETLLRIEELNKLLKLQEDENHKKEIETKSQLVSIQIDAKACEEKYEAKIKYLESELSKFKHTTNPDATTVCGHEEEIAQLQEMLTNYKEVISNLEAKLLLVEERCLQMENTESKLRHQNSELLSDLQKRESELTRADNLLHEKKVEIIELQALLETERISHTDPEKRGNSIFSEVEDRRQQVEKKLVKLNSLLEIEKQRNRDLLSDLTRVKNQMAFIAFGGNSCDNSKYLDHIENLLRCTNLQNKELLERIEQLEKEKTMSTSLSELDSNPKWLHMLLQQNQQAVNNHRAEIRQHIRTNLCQTEQLIQQGKRVNEVEKSLQKAHAEIARLKIMLEETNKKENAQSNSVIRCTTNSRFVESVKDRVASDISKALLLKERVVYQTSDSNLIDCDVNHLAETSSSTCSPAKTEEKGNPSSKEMKENSRSASTRQVRMNSKVHVLFEDGNTTLESLADDKCSDVTKVTRNTTTKKIEVIDVSKANPAVECNQQ